MKKLLLLITVGGLVYWLLKDRLGGQPDEFVFTEAPAEPQVSGGNPAGSTP